MRSAHLGPICASITGYVTDDLREVLSVFHDEHMAEHFEVGKVGRERLDLRRTCQKCRACEEDEKRRINF